MTVFCQEKNHGDKSPEQTGAVFVSIPAKDSVPDGHRKGSTLMTFGTAM
jgi:hypothetical protein